MTATMVESARKRWSINRKNILPDFIAAFTLGVASIPDSMASALLAGVSPGVMLQLERTGWLDRIGQENLFLAQRQWGVSAYQAYEAALA